MNRSAAYLWDLHTGKELRRFEGHVEEIKAVAFLPNGKQILTVAGRPASGPGTPPIPEPILLWDVETGKQIRRFEGLPNAVKQMEVSADGSRFLAVGYDLSARVWDTNTGQLLCVIPQIWDHATPSIRFDRAGTKLVGFLPVVEPSKMRIWDASTGAGLATIACDTGTFEWLEFSPDGNRVLSASSEGAVRIWDWKSGKEIQSFVGGARNVFQASYADDAKRIITSSVDRSVRIWDASTAKELLRLNHPGAVRRFLPSDDGKRLLSWWSRSDGPQNGVSLWNVESGKLIRQFDDPGGNLLKYVGFMPETQFIVATRYGKPVRLIDGATGDVIREYE